MRNIIIGIFLAVIATVSTVNYDRIENYLEIKKVERDNAATLSLLQTAEPIEDFETGSTDANDEKTAQQPLPDQAYLEVQFICQAPLETSQNWTYHEESCEEAALLQAYLYETGDNMTKQEAHEEILDMIAWQEENFGGHYDIYADQLKEMAVQFYGIPEEKVEIIYKATLGDLKREIANGHPVIVPITGEILQNPYYPYPGYHMLIAIGYVDGRIITNDNGTRRGADFSYDENVFDEAMQDAGGDIVILKL